MVHTDAGWALAIDLGTSFTAAATAAPGGPPVPLPLEDGGPLPSTVAVDGDGRLHTGRAARLLADRRPECAERDPARALAEQRRLLLGGRAVDALAPAAAVLGRVLAAARERHGGSAPTRTVLTRPAHWTDAACERLVLAAGSAGIDQPVLLPEPVAAALHQAAAEDPADCRIGVFDLGGRALRSSVLSWNGGEPVVEAAAEEPALGGDDLDECLRGLLGELVLDRGPSGPWLELWAEPAPPAPPSAAQRSLLRELTGFREALSAAPDVRVAVPGYGAPFLVRGHEFRSAAEPLVRRCCAAFAATVRSAGTEPELLHHVVLTGAACRTPLVSDLVAEATGDRLPRMAADPKASVVLGALSPRPGGASTPGARRAGAPRVSFQPDDPYLER
jgi:molecular chaperone DnaK